MLLSLAFPIPYTAGALMLATGLRLFRPSATGVASLILGFALGCMLIREEVSLPALLLVSLLLILVHQYAGMQNHPRIRSAITAATLFVSFALAIHIVPGFDNPVLAGPLRVSPDSVPFTLYASLDKGLAAFALLSLMTPQVAGVAPASYSPVRMILLAAGGIAVLLSLSTGLQLIRWEPKLPEFLPAFVAVNLLITCIAEETFFRGVIQEKLQQRWRSASGQWLAILIAALLFGLAHAASGPAYVLIATLAGALYGYVYQRSRSLPLAVVCHASLNLTHLILFSYPKLV